MTWNLAGAWSKSCNRDPRPRLARVFDILDACHHLGVAVAVFPESGLGYDQEAGEKAVAAWAKRSGCPARLWNAVPTHEAASWECQEERRRASPWWPSAPGRRAQAL